MSDTKENAVVLASEDLRKQVSHYGPEIMDLLYFKILSAMGKDFSATKAEMLQIMCSW